MVTVMIEKGLERFLSTTSRLLELALYPIGMGRFLFRRDPQ